MSITAVNTASGALAALRAQAPAKNSDNASKAENVQAGSELSAEQQAQVARLKERDTKVHRHEQAHLAASGGLATSGPSYTYQRGPDGVDYAIGGEVQIDTSPGSTPAETMQRARTIAAAALAPADPSALDRTVAAQARQMEQQAGAEQVQAALGNHAGHKLDQAYGSLSPAPQASISVRA